MPQSPSIPTFNITQVVLFSMMTSLQTLLCLGQSPMSLTFDMPLYAFISKLPHTNCVYSRVRVPTNRNTFTLLETRRRCYRSCHTIVQQRSLSTVQLYLQLLGYATQPWLKRVAYEAPTVMSLGSGGHMVGVSQERPQFPVCP